MSYMEPIQEKNSLKGRIYRGERIDEREAMELFSWDILELGRAGDFRRRMAFPSEEVGFIIDRIINYTNICEAACGFCAFHAEREKGYELSLDEIGEKIDELSRAGGTQVMLQGGLHPEHTLDTYCEMVRYIKEHFPQIYLHSFSPSEIVHASRQSEVTIDHVVKTLKEAGLDSVPGASDMLIHRIRAKVSPRKITVEGWRRVMDVLFRHGMKSSATMTYGMGETNEERIIHLSVLRNIQDKTGIIRAFIPWSFSPQRTTLDHIPPATGLDYLRTVAIARIFLDNVTYIQAGWLTEGINLAQIAFAMGANDMGGILTEEVVVRATGVENTADVQEFIDTIRDSGKIPVQRDSDYSVINYCL